MPGTVTIHRTRFTEEEVEAAGMAIPYDDEHTDTEVHDELSAREAVDLIRSEGLSFASTGNDWADNPDGSYIANYATGERVEESAHLSGFHPRVVAAIMAAVDA